MDKTAPHQSRPPASVEPGDARPTAPHHIAGAVGIVATLCALLSLPWQTPLGQHNVQLLLLSLSGVWLAALCWAGAVHAGRSLNRERKAPLVPQRPSHPNLTLVR